MPGVNPPRVLQALSLSARAVGRALWLAPVGFLITFLARAATAPAGLFVGAMAVRGAWASGAPGADPASVAGGVVTALTAPRTVLTALGLWLAGLLLRGALRVLWLAGAVPTLGEALSGRQAPAFAAGASWGYRRVLGTALLGALLEAAAAGSALGAAVAAGALTVRLAGRGGHAGAALLVALALTAAVAVPLAAGLLADAALSRAALRAEGPATAFVAAAVRLGHRPAAFAAVAMGVGLGVLVIGGSADLLAGTAVQAVAARVPPALLVVPELAAAVVGAMAAALMELWRLGAVAALACHAAPGDP